MMRTLRERALLALCACLVAGACASCSRCGGEKDGAAASAKAAGTPKIAAAESSFDYGKVKQGDVVEHVFRIRNEGDGELKIEKARGS